MYLSIHFSSNLYIYIALDKTIRTIVLSLDLELNSERNYLRKIYLDDNTPGP